MSEDDYIMLHRQDPTLPKIELFILFMRGDNRIPDAFSWAFSIDSKIRAMDVLFKEVLNQIPQCRVELEEIKKKGVGSGIECLKLALKYEVFLNSIYSLCENVSRVVAHLYYRKNLPQGFHKQKPKFLEQTIDTHYTNILSNTQWYDEVHSIRSEATHYLSGFITISSHSEPGYFNRPKSGGNSVLENISIDDIEGHTRQLYDNVKEFLSAFGAHFIEIIDQDARVPLPCIRTSSGLIGAKSMSLKEYLNNEPGICSTPDFNCPIAKSCKARSPVVRGTGEGI
jgi:hypothetical protein